MYDRIILEKSWKEALKNEFEKPYFLALTNHIKQRLIDGAKIYPHGRDIFRAFDTTPIDQVKAVILGQDPYHNPGQAMGLSFSVPKGMAIPASLKNIYRELQTDIEDFSPPHHGDLSQWAEQGVLMLNAVLTVEHKKPASHRNLGWQQFTDAVIHRLSVHKSNVVFLLWGNFARSKKVLIDTQSHLVLEAPHPSPLARGGFFQCKHFSRTNHYLIEHGIQPIDWHL